MGVVQTVRNVVMGDNRTNRRTKPLDIDHRIFFYKPFCEFCKMYKPHIARVNMYLDPDRQIQMVDVTSITTNLPQIFDVQQTPYLYIDGVAVVGITSEGYVKGFLVGMLEDELDGMHGYDVEEQGELVSDEVTALAEPGNQSWVQGLRDARGGG